MLLSAGLLEDGTATLPRGEAAIEPIFILLLSAGAYVGWNIGANDTANCIGTAVGCGLLSFKKAAVLVAVFVIIGAMLQGEQVMKTIGKGIVKTDLNYLAVCVALICSGFFVTLATFYRIPTSTSQAIVGGVTGIGLAVGAEIDHAKLIVIAESWLVCPLLVMALAFGLMAVVRFILNKYGSRSLLANFCKSTQNDGDAPVQILDYNQGRIIDVTGIEGKEKGHILKIKYSKSTYNI